MKSSAAAPKTKPGRAAARGTAARRARANPRIGIVSLGCPKALVDSERILTRLRPEAYQIAPSYEASSGIQRCGTRKR